MGGISFLKFPTYKIEGNTATLDTTTWIRLDSYVLVTLKKNITIDGILSDLIELRTVNNSVFISVKTWEELVSPYFMDDNPINTYKIISKTSVDEIATYYSLGLGGSILTIKERKLLIEGKDVSLYDCYSVTNTKLCTTDSDGLMILGIGIE